MYGKSSVQRFLPENQWSVGFEEAGYGLRMYFGDLKDLFQHYELH
ncbi:MAG: hypothetical protein OYG32_11985 [Rhodospirillaceae bacterium]|nr:hypothetical protein [Rhodospirillaceae bacterium]